MSSKARWLTSAARIAARFASLLGRRNEALMDTAGTEATRAVSGVSVTAAFGPSSVNILLLMVQVADRCFPRHAAQGRRVPMRLTALDIAKALPLAAIGTGLGLAVGGAFVLGKLVGRGEKTREQLGPAHSSTSEARRLRGPVAALTDGQSGATALPPAQTALASDQGRQP